MRTLLSRRSLAALLGFVLTSTLLVTLMPSTTATATDWYAAAKSAAYPFNYSADTVASVEGALSSLVDQAGPDPVALWDILNGVDDQIGNPARENQYSIKVIRDTEQKIDSLIADMTPYTGTPTDDVWKEIPNVIGWEIRALGPNVALLKRAGKGFLWTRPGSTEFTQSDYTLGLKRYAWSDSSSDSYTEPGSSQTMSVTLGAVPSHVNVGDTITLNPTFSVSPWRVTYTWTVECSSGSRTSLGTNTYTVTSADLNCGISVDVGASKAGYYPAGASSFNTLGGLITVGPGVTPPVDKVFSKVYTPKQSGTAQVGKTLTVSVKASKPKASFAYQWLRDGAPIVGATKSKYTQTVDDLGHVITVSVTGTRTGYTSTVRTTTSTRVVAPGVIARGSLKIKGSRHVGRTLTAALSHWTAGITPAFQWQKRVKDPVLRTWSWMPILGGTGSMYVLTPADLGQRLRVIVTATKPGYVDALPKASARTAKVGLGTVTTKKPVISGVLAAGQVLVVTPGDWKPVGLTLTYQWYRSNKKVAGATSATYTIQTIDEAKWLKVKVTGSAPAYRTRWSYSSSVKVPVPAPPTPPATQGSVPSPNPTTSPAPSPSPTPSSTP